MALRSFYVIDSESLLVAFSTTQAVGDAVINNSDSPNGTQYSFQHGFSTRAVTLEDTGGSVDTLEDDNSAGHIVTDGAGMVANGTAVEAESIIRLQQMSASGEPIGPVINIIVLSQNGVTGDVWGFASDAPLIPGTSYQKVGGGNIGSADYASYATQWLVTVDGTAGNDVMGAGYTDAQGDQIDGADGDDEVIYGYGGDDTILAGVGNDTIVGGIGADSLEGGAGIDDADYRQSASAVTVDLSTGTGTGGDAQGDTLTGIENVTGSDFADSLTGDANANILRGGGGNDSLQGGGGNDTLIGGAGADSLNGGTGLDTADYRTSGGSVTVNLASGTGVGGDAQGDTLSGIENLTGSDFNDSLTGDGNANLLSGSAGNDTLSGGAGNDTLSGGAGNDTLIGGAGADVLNGGVGLDRADYSASVAAVTVNLATGSGTGGDAQGDTLSAVENLTGSAFNDILTGDGNANELRGGGGTDQLDGGAGNDTLIGGTGADALDGGAGTDLADYSASNAAVTVNLATGNGTGGDAQGDKLAGIENLTGSNHSDLLTGDTNANVLRGGGGNDTMIGGGGNDTLAGGSGADTLDGGTGIDTADYGTSGAGVTVNLVTGTGLGGDAQGDALTAIENIAGSNFNDTLIGDGAANILNGGAGQDSLAGGVGNDTLQGGTGNDTLVGGVGADVLDGGAGIDTADYSDSATGVTVNLSLGTGVGGDAQGDTLSGIENVTGTALSDSLTGDANANVLAGGAGADTLAGGAGADSLMGGVGADSLDGGAGNDTLGGGDGNDTLRGGIGLDTLYGGLGDDEMYLAKGDSAYGGDGDDLFILSDLGEAGTGTLFIDGGSGAETTGDTLNLNALADRTTLNYSASATDPDAYDGSFSMYDGTVVTFSNMDNIVCFTPGTRILTGSGERPIETLRCGDMIVTLDHGLQPLRWIGASTVRGDGILAPVALNPALLPGARRPLLVSPQHRVLFRGFEAELMFGDLEVLISALHMVDGRDARRLPRPLVTYIHLLFDAHEIIYAEGAATESLHYAEESLKALNAQSLAKLHTAMPHLRGNVAAHGKTARRCLKKHETKVLLEANGIRKNSAESETIIAFQPKAAIWPSAPVQQPLENRYY